MPDRRAKAHPIEWGEKIFKISIDKYLKVVYNKIKVKEERLITMTVERSEDRNYPFTIKGGWGDKVYCTIDDLKDIKNQINKILREEKRKKGLTKLQ